MAPARRRRCKGICGLQPVSGGAVRYDGDDVTGRPAFELVRRGLAMVPEGRGVFGALTIEENLAMGAYTRTDRGGIAADLERVYTLFPRLRERRKQTAGTLSGGEQQMLAMGRSLMSRPKLLLLDEPSMGLAPLMVQKVFETVIAVSAEGVTILLIEQNAKLALEIAHRGYVMESGEITLAGEAKTLLARSRGARRVPRRDRLNATPGARGHGPLRSVRGLAPPRASRAPCAPSVRSRGTPKRCGCSSGTRWVSAGSRSRSSSSSCCSTRCRSSGGRQATSSFRCSPAAWCSRASRPTGATVRASFT